MPDTPLSAISAAAADPDLMARITAAAAEAGVTNPQAWAQMNALRVASEPITSDGDTVASVHAYAVATYNPPPRPGANPAAVTDAYIRAAVAAARGPISTP